jgi:hypothetical protein
MQEPAQQNPPEDSLFSEDDYSMKGYDKHIRNARIMLFVIAGLQLLPIVLMGDVPSEVRWFVIGVSVLAAAVFAGLALWTKTRPYPALLIATIFYVGIIVLNVILSGPATILQGIIFKVIIIVLLILGIRNAREAEEMKKTFGRD